MGSPIADMLAGVQANQDWERQRMQALQAAQAANPSATLADLGAQGQPSVATQDAISRVAEGTQNDPISGLAALYARFFGGGQPTPAPQATPVPTPTPGSIADDPTGLADQLAKERERLKNAAY